MPTQRIEPAAAGFTFVTAALTWIADVLHWMSDNAAAISVIVVIGGFVIQLWASLRNKAKGEAEELRAQAEELRAQEEHRIKMAILRGEIPDRRSVIDHVEAVEK